MAALTKLALTQANTALADDNATLRAQVGVLQVEVSILLEKVLSSIAVRAVTIPVAPVRVKPPMPQWQIERAACMAAAKAVAMSSNRAVKV